MDQAWRNWTDLNETEQREVQEIFGYMGQPLLERLAWRRNPEERINNPRPGRAMGKWSGDSMPLTR